ncbi:hypothetical protein [Gloeothece verrucosa]|uniref:Cell division protein FtsL n=1 Tax=Gloeothece verrucosa (strain PCC 7822) TaxID=497965 RepID=E0U716_GLOV7|nr:hypothetical protein [Gloeothece verrucosa]ADN17172.1 conserved hypothetical protein [Gloeothece verrucosa PCC 7822]
MSLAPYPIIPEEPTRYKKYRTRTRSSRRLGRNKRETHLTTLEGSSHKRQPTVESLKSSSRMISPQLRFMLQLQKVSSVITFCLIAATLGIYAWTVYVPRLWSKEYRNLETLQRHERHLTAANETIKNQLAQQAEEPKAGLINPKPEQAIFLPQTNEPAVRTATPSNSAQNKPFIPDSPVSY